jgi:hypothetical protein
VQKTSHDLSPTSSKRPRSKGARPAPGRSGPEALSEARPHSTAAAESLGPSTVARQSKHQYICPKCGGRSVRMHRRFGERLLSLVSPVRRYACTNQLCAHEAVVLKNSALTQRPLVAVAGMIGATLAGALVTGLGLYATSDAPTRAEMRDGFVSVLQPDAGDQRDVALPVSRKPPEPEYETASILQTASDTGDVRIGLVPSVPATLAPFANPLSSPPKPR